MTERPAPLCGLDLDGTLVDSGPDICLHINGMLQHMGLPTADHAEILTHVGHGASQLVNGVLQRFPQVDAAAALEVFRGAYRQRPLVHSRLYDGVGAALDALVRAGFRLAVVTNKPLAIAQQLLEGLGIRARFHAVMGSEAGLPLKPDPAMLWAAAAQAGADPARVCMVGDSTVDLDTALAAGCPFAGVSYGLDGGAGLRARGIALHPALGAAVDAVAADLKRKAPPAAGARA